VLCVCIAVLLQIKRMQLANKLWASGIKAEFGFKPTCLQTVYCVCICLGLQIKRMQLANKLWASGIKAEFGFKPNPKMGDQLGYALEQGIPFMILFGDDELQHGVVKVRLLLCGGGGGG
jgi:threonyl-tRNA synthetase